MPANTATTQTTTNLQRRLVLMATDFIEGHKTEPISHNTHSKPLTTLLLAVYELGRKDAYQEVLGNLDRDVIEPIQAKIDK